MKKLSLMAIIAVILVAGCKKADNSSPATIAYPDYFPAMKGSYWVFENYRIDSGGTETKYSELDSLYAVGDTVINNKTYHVVQGNRFPRMSDTSFRLIFRDSLHYLVAPDGSLLFSSENFADTLQHSVQIMNMDTLLTISNIMNDPGASFELPAGDFKNVLNARGNIEYFSLQPGWAEAKKFLNNYYAMDVGPIASNLFFLAAPFVIEKRLVRYHIEESH